MSRGPSDVAGLILAVDKHKIAGIAAMVVGAVVLLFGVLRTTKRLSGAALVLLAGAVIVIIGVLVATHTIHA
jgi:hypothetical protein